MLVWTVLFYSGIKGESKYPLLYVTSSKENAILIQIKIMRELHFKVTKRASISNRFKLLDDLLDITGYATSIDERLVDEYP